MKQISYTSKDDKLRVISSKYDRGATSQHEIKSGDNI